MTVVHYTPPAPQAQPTGTGGFSWEIIPPATQVVIPYGQQMLVVGDVTIDLTGELVVEGSLIILREGV